MKRLQSNSPRLRAIKAALALIAVRPDLLQYFVKPDQGKLLAEGCDPGVALRAWFEYRS